MELITLKIILSQKTGIWPMTKKKFVSKDEKVNQFNCFLTWIWFMGFWHSRLFLPELFCLVRFFARSIRKYCVDEYIYIKKKQQQRIQTWKKIIYVHELDSWSVVNYKGKDSSDSIFSRQCITTTKSKVPWHHSLFYDLIT